MTLFFKSKETKAPGNTMKKTWKRVLLEQVINAAIIGGIAGAASLADLDVALRAFVITFLIELRKYRNI